MANSRKIANAIFLIERHPPQAALRRRCPARGFGVDVGERARERVRAGVTQFSPQVPEKAVLVWCCGPEIPLLDRAWAPRYNKDMVKRSGKGGRPMYNPQLDTFLAVVEAGSFNKAAERLYISPPAVIKQINLLESSLGVRLFTRTHRGLILTEAGRSLAQDARYIVQYCKDSVTRARNAAGREQEVLRIGTSPMTPAQVLVDLWPKIQEDCPGVKFQLVPYDNTPENAREILAHLGQNIDVVAGIFDETMLALRQCTALELSREPICCAVSAHHRLAAKDRLAVEDLYGERLMLIKRGWSRSVDRLREDLWKNHPQIQIVDFDFYNTEAFNQCENNNCVLMAMDYWRYVHPLMKILPVEWDYTIPFGLFHAPDPSPVVERFLKAVEKVCRG